MTSLKHHHSLRVYYADTDAQGIVYHANYLRFMEQGRVELEREIGFKDAENGLQDLGYFVAGEVNLRYKASARLDDLLIVETQVSALGNASVKFRQNILKRVADSDSHLLEGTITLIYLGQDGRPARIPQMMRDALQPYLMTKEA